jgi:hypothetical protein
MALPEPLRASAQHIGLLHDKRRQLNDKRHRLVDAQVSAELQFLAALRREYEAGQTSWTQLDDAYATLSAGKLRGLRGRWMDAIGISPEKVIANAQGEAARRAQREAARRAQRMAQASAAASRPAPIRRTVRRAPAA